MRQEARQATIWGWPVSSTVPTLNRVLAASLALSMTACGSITPAVYRVTEPSAATMPTPVPKPVVITKTRTKTRTVRDCPDIDPWPLTKGEAGKIPDEMRDWILQTNAWLRGCE